MGNATKRYLSGLEARVIRLENIIQSMLYGAESANSVNYTCNQCGAFDPQNQGFVCDVPDCCQGLNPNDDVD